MRYTVLIGVADLALGICGGGDTIDYACLPKTLIEKWVTLAQGGNLNVNPNLYTEYREELAAVATNKSGQCNASLEDLYWPEGSKKANSDQGKKLLAGDRAGLADFQDWEAHPLSVVSGSCKDVCGKDAVPVKLITRNENFYNTVAGSDLSKAQVVPCKSIMAGFLNYYQTMPGCEVPGKPAMKIGIKDTLGVCVKKGTKFSSDGTTVLRDGTWYKPPKCLSVRIIGQETQKPLIAPGSCKCCGEFEYHTPTSGVTVYALGRRRSSANGGNAGRGGGGDSGRDDPGFRKDMEKKLCCYVDEHHSRQLERTVKDALKQCEGQKASKEECDKLKKATKAELEDYMNGNNNVSLKSQACNAWLQY